MTGIDTASEIAATGFADLGHGRQPDVGNAEQHIGDAGPGNVNGLKAEIFDDAREQGVGCSGHGDGGAARQQVLQSP